jgi:hypothetical protein
MAVPKEPAIFMKAPSAIWGPDDKLVIPRGSIKTDWGRSSFGLSLEMTATYVTKPDTPSHVARILRRQRRVRGEFRLEGTGQRERAQTVFIGTISNETAFDMIVIARESFLAIPIRERLSISRKIFPSTRAPWLLLSPRGARV